MKQLKTERLISRYGTQQYAEKGPLCDESKNRGEWMDEYIRYIGRGVE